MVTIGIVLFALLLERTGMFPALVALVLIASLGGEEFKIVEVIGNIIVLTILSNLLRLQGRARDEHLRHRGSLVRWTS